MSPAAAEYFDGRSARSHAVHLQLLQGQLQWHSAAGQGQLQGAEPLEGLRWEASVGTGQKYVLIHLPSGGMFRVADRAILGPEWDLQWADVRGSSLQRCAQWMERRWINVLTALVLVVGLVFSALRWGVPFAAEKAVPLIPRMAEAAIGAQSFRLLEQMLLPTQLPMARQQALALQLHGLCQKLICPIYDLQFRTGRGIGANALALPGGTVVVTDELIQLAQHDEEILAVLLHELGHVQHRHGLRMALQSLGAGAVLVAITGDVGSVSDVAAGLPAWLLQNGYSRAMEREADAYALRQLQAACVTPQRLADILGRIDSRPAQTGLLDSHPGTAERMRHFSIDKAC